MIVDHKALGKKVALIRDSKGMNQDEMAAKLNMSSTGYAKIEQGKTKLLNPRLEKIAKTLEVKLDDLLNLNEKNTFNTSFHDQCLQYSQNVYISSAIELTKELERMKILVEQKDKEIALMKQQIEDLRSMLDFLKK